MGIKPNDDSEYSDIFTKQRRLKTFKTKAFWTRTASNSDFPRRMFPLRHLATSAAAIECKSDPNPSTSGSFGFPYQILNFFCLFCLRVPQRETTMVTWLQLRVCRRTKRAPACVYSNHKPTSVDCQSCKNSQHVSQPRVFNPSTARLVPAVTRKTISDSAKLEIIMAFFPLRMSTWKDFYQNAQY